MLLIILVACGALFHLYSLYICYKLNTNTDRNAVKRPYPFAITVLIFFFFIAYLIYLARLAVDRGNHGLYEILASVIFFFGAVFVVLVIKTNAKLIEQLVAKSSELIRANQDLKNANKELEEKNKMTEEAKHILENKTKELQENIEELYEHELK